jgi:alcohol dehydrogenase (cytochrome c)
MKKIIYILCLFGVMNLKSQTIEDLNAGIKNTDNITNFGLGYDLKMFSPLKQINSKNVKKLVPIWSTSLSNEVGEHSQPTVFNGVMYIVNGNWTFAFDVMTGKQLWRVPVRYQVR